MACEWLLLVMLPIGLVCGDIRFFALGDWGDPLEEETQTQVSDAMAVYAETFQPQLIQSLGDNFYPEGLDSTSDPKFDTLWRYMYNQSSLINLPWMISIGNHDYGVGNSGEWFQVNMSEVEPRWVLPNLWHDYILNDGLTSVHMIIIDTDAIVEQQNNPEEMLQWLDQTLALSTTQWTIVVAHRPVYSTGATGAVDQVIYDNVLPILEAHNVDVYLTGHDHNAQYLRKIGDSSYTDFLVSGVGGAQLSFQRTRYIDELRDNYNIESVFFSDTHGFVALTITQDAITAEMMNTDLVSLYSFTRPATAK